MLLKVVQVSRTCALQEPVLLRNGAGESSVRTFRPPEVSNAADRCTASAAATRNSRKLSLSSGPTVRQNMM